MHELSIALSIIDVAEEELVRLDVHQVIAIHLSIGELAGVDQESLSAAFEVASEDTSCSKSRLVFEKIAVLAFCPACGEPRSIVSLQQFDCAVCSSPVSTIVQGRELQITAMEVE